MVYKKQIPMNKPLVSIILATYNSEDYLTECLKSIFSTSYPNFELIIIDNKSTDKTINIIKKFKDKYKENINLILSSKNLGYAKANNKAVKQSKGDFIFILNPDTIVSDNFLEPLIEEIIKPNVSAVQPLVYLFDKKTINLTGKVTHYLGFDWLKDFKKTNIPKRQVIKSFSGSGILVSKEYFNKVGGFDELFFMYYEDSDLSWKFNLIDKKIIFTPKSVLLHDYKYIPKDNYQPLKQKLFYIERNRLITLFKNLSLKSLLLILPSLIFMELGMIVFSFYEGWGITKLKTYFSILNNMSLILKNRRLIQSQRKISDKLIFKNFVSSITFEKFSNPIIKYFVNPILSAYFLIIKVFI
jgi:GT2 family glycosyltransferase